MAAVLCPSACPAPCTAPRKRSRAEFVQLIGQRATMVDDVGVQLGHERNQLSTDSSTQKARIVIRRVAREGNMMSRDVLLDVPLMGHDERSHALVDTYGQRGESLGTRALQHAHQDGFGA